VSLSRQTLLAIFLSALVPGLLAGLLEVWRERRSFRGLAASLASRLAGRRPKR
jgi:hypothetical protein